MLAPTAPAHAGPATPYNCTVGLLAQSGEVVGGYSLCQSGYGWHRVVVQCSGVDHAGSWVEVRRQSTLKCPPLHPKPGRVRYETMGV